MTEHSQESPIEAELDDPVARLVSQIQSGIDVERNFERLHQLYHPRLIRYFFLQGQPPAVCEELTQEAFLRVFNEIGTFQHRSKFTTWLYSIVRNLNLNERRKSRAAKRDGYEQPLEEEIAPGAEEPWNFAPALVSNAPRADEEIERREQSAILQKAISGLPPQMRRCVFLRVNQGLKYREVAVVMGINIDTVKAHLGQATARLRRELGGGPEALAQLADVGPGNEGES